MNKIGAFFSRYRGEVVVGLLVLLFWWLKDFLNFLLNL